MDWLVYGRGAKYAPAPEESRERPKMAKMSAVLKDAHSQPSDFIDSKKMTMADRQPFYVADQIFILQRELLDATRQNGDLRVEVERLRARIAELERKLAEALNPPGGQTLLDKRNAAAG